MKALTTAAFALALSSRGAVRRLRREVGGRRPWQPGALRRRARLLRERRPRGALRGARSRLLPRRRPRRPPARPLGPLGADQGGRRRPGGPGDLVRARGASGARPGPAGEGRGRRRTDAAHLPDLAPGLRDTQGQGPARQDGGHGRHPLPGGVPGARSSSAPASPPTTSTWSTSSRGSCRRSAPAAPTRCSAAS